jgi:hypothetical protein
MQFFQNIINSGDNMVMAGVSIACAVAFFINLKNGGKQLLITLALIAVAAGLYTQRVPIFNGIGNLLSSMFN